MRKLTNADLLTVVTLAAKETPQREIARRVGVSQAQISRILSGYEDTRALATATLHAKAAEVADAAITAASVASKRGDGSVALELLDRIDVSPKKIRESIQSGPKVLVVVGHSTPNALPPALTIEHT